MKPIEETPNDGLLIVIDRDCEKRERRISRQVLRVAEGEMRPRWYGQNKPGGRRRLEKPRVPVNSFSNRCAVSPKRLFQEIIDYADLANVKRITRTGNWR